MENTDFKHDESLVLVAVMINNNVGNTSSIQFQSPTGKTIGLYLNRPPVSDQPKDVKDRFFAIYKRAKQAIEERKKWEDEHKPVDEDKIKWKVFAARVAHRFPPGMTTAYLNITISEMRFISDLYNQK
jgi:hypothetical protein